MKAVVIDRITKAHDVALSDIPIPEVKPGWVLIKVKAFGMNHSEQILRLSEINANYIKKPVVPGIECVGEIVNPSDTDLTTGQKVVALMGGMGRSFDGSYAEYALLPRKIVFPVKTALDWASLAAVPETYFTAWGSLFECLHLTSDDILLVRGATCALGYVSIQLAKTLGCKVIATTHRESKLPLIDNADKAVIDNGNLAEALKSEGITKVLELVGPKTVKDSLRCLVKGGICCNTGILGNVFSLNGFDPIKDIPNGVYLTGFFSNMPTQKTIENIFDFLNQHNLTPIKAAEYKFENIKTALIDMDNKKINGKIVVSM